MTRFTPEAPRCQACGYDRPEKSFDSMEKGFWVEACPSCGMGRTEPFTPGEEIGKWYPETYYGRENVRFNPVFEYLTRIFRKRRARLLHNRVPRGPVLDVGCGRGFILSYLKSLGYESHGLEFSDHAAWHARHVLGIDVETGDLLKSKHAKNHFHAVVFWHSLEHLTEPVAAVARARDLLKTGGMLAIAVPNYESLQARFFGRYWFHLDVPRHYWHFGARSLEAVLQRHHFRIVELAHFSFEQNPYGWLQSFYNALGFKNNFLYDMLKNSSARASTLRRHPIQCFLTLLLLPPLLAASLFMTVFEAAIGRGGTIELYAIKE